MAKKATGPNGPTVNELRAQRRFARFEKLGKIAMWNALTKKVVDLKSPTLGLMQKFAPDTFQDLISSPRPVSMGDPKFTW